MATETPSSEIRKGSCLCKAVQFELTGKPFTQALCHCVNCRKTGGSSFMPIDFNKETQFKIIKGEDQVKTYDDKATASGGTIFRRFCGICGSSLYATSTKYQGVLLVGAGALDDNQKWAPTKEYYCRDRWGFLPDIEGIEQVH